MNNLEIKPCIYFEQIPLPYNVSCKSDNYYRVRIRMPDLKEHYIDLYAINSYSYPIQESHVFDNLIPQWKFTDLDDNIITRIKTTDTIIRNEYDTIIGVEGYVDFYYYDDMPSGGTGRCPVVLMATIDTKDVYVDESVGIDISGYSNSKLEAACLQYIIPLEPNFIGISFDGNLNHKINKVKWTDKNVYCTFTVNGSSINRETPTLFYYPSSNALGSTHYIYRELKNSSEVLSWVTMPESADYFQKIDANGFVMGGFSRQYFTPQVVASACYIKGVVTVKYERPYNLTDFYEDREKVFFANPVNHSIDCLLTQLNLSGCSIPSFILSSGVSVSNYDYLLVSFDTASAEIIPPMDYLYSEGYGIAVEPSAQCIWYCDTQFDLLVKYDYLNQEIIKTIYLPASSSPTSVSLDSNRNIWLSLYDDDKIIKYNNVGTKLFEVAMPTNRVSPYAVCTDKNDNVYVSTMGIINNLSGDGLQQFEANSSGLLKYNSSGTYITAFNIPASSQPQDLLVDIEDNTIWVANSFDILLPPYTRNNLLTTGCVQKWGSNVTTPLSTIYYPRPEYLTMDKYNGLWGTFGYGNLFHKASSVKNPSGFVKYIVKNDNIFLDDIINNYDNIILGEPYPGVAAEFNEMFNGIAADNSGNIWLLNTEKNKIYSFYSQNPLNTFKAFKLSGKGMVQSLGDWTGVQWKRKYNYIDPARPFTTTTKNITGFSNEFDILEFSNSYGIRKFNESWNPSAQAYSYVFPEFMREFTKLWQGFVGSMLGGEEDYSLTRSMYERIANFVGNNNCVDTCNLDQFYSLINSIALEVDDYKLDYPFNMKRIVDLFSINRQVLWGDTCKCKKSIIEGVRICPYCNHEHTDGKNIGTEIGDSTNYRLSTNIPVVLKDIRKKTADAYTIYNFVSYYYDNTLNTFIHITSTPLSSLRIDGYRFPIYAHYDVFNYNDVICNKQVEGIINWEDSNTTIDNSIANLKTMYDDDGFLSEIISYNLYEGLK